MNDILKNKIIRFLYIFLLLIIIFYPKISIIHVNGTYIGIRIEDIIISLFLIISIIFYKFDFLKNNNLKKLLIMFSIYIVFCSISSIFGLLNGYINLKMSLLYIMRKIEMFSFIIVGYYAFKTDKKSKYIIIKIIYFSIFFHTIYMFLNYFGIIGTYLNGKHFHLIYGRQQSTFNGPYEFSAFMTFIEPIIIINLLKHHHNYKKIIINVFMLLCQLLCVYFSKSRSSLLIYLFMFLIIPMIYYRKNIIGYIRKKFLKSFIIFVAFIIFSIIGFICIFNTNRFKTLNINTMLNDIGVAWHNRNLDDFNNNNYIKSNGDLSFSLRISKWCNLLDGVGKHPAIGLGVSVSKEALDGNYVRIFCESGLLGLILWVLFIVLTLDLVRKTNNPFKYYIIFGVVTLLLQALLVDIFEASKIMMLYYFLLGYTLNNIDKTKKEYSIKNSIVMASYNGEKYIADQIDSILKNMSSNDELIISDDGSTDKTISIIKQYQKTDKRIKLINGPKKGVKMNFQNAIINATGENIFLADQDDIWMNDKIKIVSQYLKDYNVVTHNALIVDKDLKNNDINFFKYRKSGKGILKNIYKNTYIGCCMAFKADLKDKILPIPNDIEMHDQWIGIIGEKYGDNIFINDCLIKYRRHNDNVSKMTHHPLKKMLINRFKFIKNYIKR